LAAELTYFAAELTRTACGECLLSPQSVFTSGDYAAFGDEPYASIAVTNIENVLAGLKTPCWAACKAQGKLQLTRRERREDLRFPLFKQHVDISPFGLRRVVCTAH
jgi:hypothetical protein